MYNAQAKNAMNNYIKSTSQQMRDSAEQTKAAAAAGMVAGIIPKATNTKLGDSSSDKSGSSNKGGGGNANYSEETYVEGGNDMQAYLEEMARQRMARAQAAYEQGMEKLSDIYGRQRESYDNVYNSGVGQIDNSYGNSLGKINTSAEKAMQEAYINRMLSERNLSQKMAAQGLSGGASESAMAGLINNYGNARNGIQETWDTNKADLEMQKNNSLAQLYDAYQQNLAQLEANRGNAELSLLNNLNNQIDSVDNAIFEAMLKNPQILSTAVSTAAGTMGAYSPAAQSVSNPYSTVSTQQGNDMGQATQGARVKALEEYYKNGGSTQNAGITGAQIAANGALTGYYADQLRNMLASNPNASAQQGVNYMTGLGVPAANQAQILNQYSNLGYFR